MSIIATMFVNTVPNGLSACKRLFSCFCSIVKLRKAKKASSNFRLNESQKIFLLPAQCAITLYTLEVIQALLF